MVKELTPGSIPPSRQILGRFLEVTLGFVIRLDMRQSAQTRLEETCLLHQFQCIFTLIKHLLVSILLEFKYIQMDPVLLQLFLSGARLRMLQRHRSHAVRIKVPYSCTQEPFPVMRVIEARLKGTVV